MKYPSLISSGTIDDKETYTKRFPDYLPVRMVVNNGICYCLAKSATDNSYTLFTFAFGDENPTKTKVKVISNLSPLAKCTDMLYFNDYIYMIFNDNNDSIYTEQVPNPYIPYEVNSSGVLVQYDTYTSSVLELGNSNNISFSGMYYVNGDSSQITTHNGSLYALSGEIPLSNSENLSKYFPSVKSPEESNLSSSFVGSEKFLAIMPKKLVLSDHGRFYYADVNDALSYKVINRIVDIDLEGFCIDSVSNVNANVFNNINAEWPFVTLYLGYADLDELLPLGDYVPDGWTGWDSSSYLGIKPDGYPEP